jgi:multiple sugar transport system substrate-binding protein
LKVARVPFPKETGGTSNSIHMAANLAPAKRELVWRFMELAASPKWQSEYVLRSAAPAPRRGALPADAATRLPHLKLVMDAAASAVSVFPSHPAMQESYNEYASLFGRAMMRLITSDEPTDRVLANLQRELERAIPLR